MTRQFAKPVKMHPAHFDELLGAADPALQQQLGDTVAWALLHRVRQTADTETVARVLQHAAAGGLDDIAALWENAHPASLAGVLWRLYLIHTAANTRGTEIALMFQAGTAAAAVATAIAAVTEPVAPAAVLEFCDEVLRGVFEGDFGAALERAWAYCEVLAVGAAALADERQLDNPAQATELTMRGARYQRLAQQLQLAARRWRAGQLD